MNVKLLHIVDDVSLQQLKKKQVNAKRYPRDPTV